MEQLSRRSPSQPASERELPNDLEAIVSRWHGQLSDDERRALVFEILERGYSVDRLAMLTPHPTLEMLTSVIAFREARCLLDAIAQDTDARSTVLLRIATLPLTRSQLEELAVAPEIERLYTMAYARLLTAGFSREELRNVPHYSMVALVFQLPLGDGH